MEYDTDKIDEATLALLYLVMWQEHDWHRAWKSFDWDTMDRLHEKGWIGEPKGKAKSVGVSDEGAKRAKELFEKLFGKPE
ncbi:MAG: hypothetical protein HN341_18195 [Verrucomicrobia bacterium]|jgi:hypothetical protein|nr:hypothetical protein [Verrucomicrobiota bacterium]